MCWPALRILLPVASAPRALRGTEAKFNKNRPQGTRPATHLTLCRADRFSARAHNQSISSSPPTPSQRISITSNLSPQLQFQAAQLFPPRSSAPHLVVPTTSPPITLFRQNSTSRRFAALFFSHAAETAPLSHAHHRRVCRRCEQLPLHTGPSAGRLARPVLL